MEVRPLRETEYGEAGRISRETFAPIIAGYEWGPGYLDKLGDVAGRARSSTVLGALVDNRLIGTITVDLDIDPPRARMLAVDEGFRGVGAGRSLMVNALALARERGAGALVLQTLPEMTVAQRLYDGLGFRRDPSADEYEEGRLALLSYRIDL